MDIKSVNSFIELQALQTVGTATKSSPYNTSAAFTELMSAFLTQSSSEKNALVNQLGSLQSLLGEQPRSVPLTQNFAKPVVTNTLDYKPAAKIEQYQTPDFTGAEAYSSVLAGAQPYQEMIQKASEKYNVPEKLIASVMKQESNFNPTAVSYAGATGLMQLMPATARYLGVNNPTDPEQNIMGGAKYLRKMLDQFDDNISTALAAYNAGPGNVQKYSGIPPFKETQNYVKKVLNYFQT